MSDSTKARLCLQQIVDLFKSGNVPKALAVATIPPQAGIPSAKWSWSNRLLQFLKVGMLITFLKVSLNQLTA